MKIPDMKELGLNELEPKDRTLYLMWESSQARMERTNKMQFIVILVLIIALIGTNAGWIWYESQFEDSVTTTVTQEATSDGNSDINLRGIGDNYYGRESETDSYND
jgi:hypothetical protein